MHLTNYQTLKARGFTLIELIVVILILAVLAAIALPRFTNLQKDARIAKLNAAKGSVSAAATMLHAAVLAKNNTADTSNCASESSAATNTSSGTVCTENGLITMSNYYPSVTDFGSSGAAATNAGILSAAGLTTTFNPSQTELQAEGYDFSVSGTTATFIVKGGSDETNCSFTYAEAASNAAPVISSVTTTGC